MRSGLWPSLSRRLGGARALLPTSVSTECERATGDRCGESDQLSYRNG